MKKRSKWFNQKTGEVCETLTQAIKSSMFDLVHYHFLDFFSWVRIPP